MANIASLYIHIPFCDGRCAYCDFFSTVQKDSSLFSPYVEALIKDISFFKKKYKIQAFSTVYIGGGTPSLLPIELILKLSEFIQNEQKQKITEFTLEANPEDITKEKLKNWQESGINRLSIGIQSFNDEVLKAERRRGSRAKSINALKMLQNEWQGIVSLDFIAGLQKQTHFSLIEDLKIATSFSPEHISLYELILPEGHEDSLQKETIWKAGSDFLESANYKRYEISNFSYNGCFECEHNMTYWNLRDYIGIGAGATGNVKIANFPNVAMRFTGIYDVASYITKENRNEAYTAEKIDEKDLLKDAILMGMRLCRGISLKDFAASFGVDILLLIPLTIAHWQKMKLLSINDSFISLNRRGLLLLNAFLRDVFLEIK